MEEVNPEARYRNENMNKRIKEIFWRFVSVFFPIPGLFRIIQSTVGKDKIVRIGLNGIMALTDKNERMKIFLGVIARLIEPEERFLLLSFEKGYGREPDRFIYQKEYVHFNIKGNERVLDIGSGAYPFPYATHLADLYPKETTHRNEPLARDGRPFKVCNIESLPYHDKEFDFVYCSHILEHVNDPARACEEIMRVGKRGYIETPTRMSDIMLNFTSLQNHHKWHINLLGDTLIFMEWNDKERRDTGHDEFFKMFISKYKNPFQDLVHNHRDLFVNMLLWENKFFYYIFNRDGHLAKTNR
jgi:SAM-dependent methyltransferase